MRAVITAVRAAFGDARMPVYLGAIGPRMLHLTGTAADGWLASTHAPFEAGLAAVRTAAYEAGRALDALDLCVPLNADEMFPAAIRAAESAGATSVRIIPTGVDDPARLASLASARADC
jgi:alkanesulfonate monooxygenase SsuD/methylene tetrahydromethanopterin reductase-like flavin-dependent oxidoreductase (luciferase family)